jgi:hypothetical protein
MSGGVLSGKQGRVTVRTKVCKIKVWDNPTGQWIVEPGKFTEEALKAIPRSEIIAGADEEVDDADIGQDGRYLPPDESQALRDQLTDLEAQLKGVEAGIPLGSPWENRGAGLRHRIAAIKSMLGKNADLT